jgi:hypothetical protein
MDLQQRFVMRVKDYVRTDVVEIAFSRRFFQGSNLESIERYFNHFKGLYHNFGHAFS